MRFKLYEICEMYLQPDIAEHNWSSLQPFLTSSVKQKLSNELQTFIFILSNYCSKTVKGNKLKGEKTTKI